MRARPLDWENRPHPFKVYEGAEEIDLPHTSFKGKLSALESLETSDVSEISGTLDLPSLSRLLELGAGVARSRDLGGGERFYFRTYASAGALYPVEIYLVTGEIPGLAAGVYHFAPRKARLALLRSGDHRGILAAAAAGEQSVSTAPVTLVFTGIPWRTSWKYGERGYRHLFWDTGMIIANVLALSASEGIGSRIVLGFADGEVGQLLGIDGRDEFPLALMPLGREDPHHEPSSEPEPIAVQARPFGGAVEYPGIREINEAGSLQTGEEVESWRSPPPPPDLLHGWEAVQFQPVETHSDSIEEVIARRGSARFFEGAPVPGPILADILERSMEGFPTDYAPSDSPLIQPYLIASNVDSLPPGSYVWTPVGFRMLRAGDFRREAAHLCLDQPLAAQAAVVVFLMIELDSVHETLGDRGYRIAQLEGGIVGGKIYLASYAHRFGATGLTFYDDEVTRFLSPDSDGQNCMLVIAIGESPRLRRQK